MLIKKKEGQHNKYQNDCYFAANLKFISHEKNLFTFC